MIFTELEESSDFYDYTRKIVPHDCDLILRSKSHYSFARLETFWTTYEVVPKRKGAYVEIICQSDSNPELRDYKKLVFDGEVFL